jgi:hypothetical protein
MHGTGGRRSDDHRWHPVDLAIGAALIVHTLALIAVLQLLLSLVDKQRRVVIEYGAIVNQLMHQRRCPPL